MISERLQPGIIAHRTEGKEVVVAAHKDRHIRLIRMEALEIIAVLLPVIVEVRVIDPGAVPFLRFGHEPEDAEMLPTAAASASVGELRLACGWRDGRPGPGGAAIHLGMMDRERDCGRGEAAPPCACNRRDSSTCRRPGTSPQLRRRSRAKAKHAGGGVRVAAQSRPCRCTSPKAIQRWRRNCPCPRRCRSRTRLRNCRLAVLEDEGIAAPGEIFPDHWRSGARGTLS